MSEGAIKIDELIDSNPIGGLQWRVVVLCFSVAMIDGFDAQSIGYVAPLLAEQFSLSPDVMGQLYSSALIGLMVGALVGSSMADRIGRKPVIILSVAVMGLFALLTATAGSTTELFLYRFLTGIGLGGVMPNVNILTAEFAPARRRALLMTVMFVGFPIGTIVGGLAAAGLIQAFGWESVFIVGGAVPLALVPLLVFLLPESPRFLALKPDHEASLAQIVNRIAPDTSATATSRFETLTPQQPGGSIQGLFTAGRTPITLLLWVVYFANLLTLFAMVAWLPSVLNAAGFPLERAILATVLFATGGVIGGLLIAAAVDRMGAIPIMVAAFAVAAVAVGSLGQVTGSLTLLIIILFLAGVTAMGSQFGLNAITSNIYDTHARATGLGWALAAGRLGAIIGPIAVGAAVSLDLPLSRLFMLGAVPMVIASASVFVLGRLKAARP